ncbi:hypothetical protein AVEN_229534-1 [Araneus ventricosus]|uniref:Uncharacterized protein n=1 Tax=Araneus ventricosus TaxID=182803 RepID=A0A4Y2EGV0_ARAVE|nr:hypothetical protein AVEN_229534-1 [Araneus ventricosus]
MIAFCRYLRDAEIAQVIETPDSEVEDASEHEIQTSEESETSDNDDNIVTQTVHNGQYIQSKHQNINWSLDPLPRSNCLNSANFIKKQLSKNNYVFNITNKGGNKSI